MGQEWGWLGWARSPPPGRQTSRGQLGLLQDWCSLLARGWEGQSQAWLPARQLVFFSGWNPRRACVRHDLQGSLQMALHAEPPVRSQAGGGSRDPRGAQLLAVGCGFCADLAETPSVLCDT